MLRGNNKRRRTSNQRDNQSVPVKRDRYDKWMLGVEIAGVAAVALTIIITLFISAQNNQDMDNALNKMSAMANAAATQAAAVQTPHVRLWVEKFDSEGFSEGLSLEAVTKIHNASAVTLFNGRVDALVAIVPLGKGADWGKLQTVSPKVVIGPEETQTFLLRHEGRAVEETVAVKANRSVIIVAVRIHYLDNAMRPHTRYLCAGYIYNFGNMVQDSCPTPEQS